MSNHKCPQGHRMVIMGTGVKEIGEGKDVLRLLVKEYWCRKCQKRYRV